MSMKGYFVKEWGHWNNQVAKVGIECAEAAVEILREGSDNKATPDYVTEPENNPKLLSTIFVRDALSKTIKDLDNEELAG